MKSVNLKYFTSPKGAIFNLQNKQEKLEKYVTNTNIESVKNKTKEPQFEF